MAVWQHLDQVEAVLNPTSVIPSGGARFYEETGRRVEAVSFVCM